MGRIYRTVSLESRGLNRFISDIRSDAFCPGRHCHALHGVQPGQFQLEIVQAALHQFIGIRIRTQGFDLPYQLPLDLVQLPGIEGFALQQIFIVFPIAADFQPAELQGLLPPDGAIFHKLPFVRIGRLFAQMLGLLIALGNEPAMHKGLIENSLARDFIGFAVKPDPHFPAIQDMLLTASAIGIGTQVEGIRNITPADSDMHVPVIARLGHHRMKDLLAPARTNLVFTDKFPLQRCNLTSDLLLVILSNTLPQFLDLLVNLHILADFGIALFPVAVFLDHAEPQQVVIILNLGMPEVPGIGIHTFHRIFLEIGAHKTVFEIRRDDFTGIGERLTRVGNGTAQMRDFLAGRRKREGIITGLLLFQTFDIGVDRLRNIFTIEGTATPVEKIFTPLDPNRVVLFIQIC